MAGPGLQTDFGRTPALPGGPWPWRAVLGFVGAWDSEGTGPCLPWAPIPGPSVSTETRVAMAHTTSLGRGKPSAGGGGGVGPRAELPTSPFPEDVKLQTDITSPSSEGCHADGIK